jgi:SAM-dependent methyltransferase
MVQPIYGASAHYTGDRGEAYFRYQGDNIDFTGELEARKFQRFIEPSSTVVDFGAGSGAVLASLTAKKKLAIEINAAARDYCSTHFEIEALATSADVDSDFADVVISNHCLEHVPCPVAAVQEVWRILNRGGLFLLCLPLDDWRTQKRYNPHDINHHLHTWTPLLLGHTLSEGGFAHPEIRIMTSAWPPGVTWWYSRLPLWAFDVLCWSFAVAMKRRQLFAVARKN